MADQHEHARTFYDRISGVYDALSDASEHRYRDRGLELLAAQPDEVVLEIGYGTGHTVADLAEAVGAGGLVAGVDVSQGMHDVALQRLTERGLESRVDLRVAPAPPLAFDDGAFDAAFLSFTLELFEPDVLGQLLDELRRTLKPRGRLGVVCMATVDEGEKESLLERTYKWMHRHFPHIVDCRPIAADRLLAEQGFELDVHEKHDMFTMPVSVLVARPR